MRRSFYWFGTALMAVFPITVMLTSDLTTSMAILTALCLGVMVTAELPKRWLSNPPA
jgi:energy-coupling factor transporter transmembrane protein EcfT